MFEADDPHRIIRKKTKKVVKNSPKLNKMFPLYLNDIKHTILYFRTKAQRKKRYNELKNEYKNIKL